MSFVKLRRLVDFVALFTRAWIEIYHIVDENTVREVALFTRAWIEMLINSSSVVMFTVALFTRAWIEIQHYNQY